MNREELQAVRLRRLDHAQTVFEGERHDLLAEDVLAIVRRVQRVLGVELIG